MKTRSVNHVNLNVYALDMVSCYDGWKQKAMFYLGSISLPEGWTTRLLYRALREKGWLYHKDIRLEDTTEWDCGYEICKRRGAPFLFVREEAEAIYAA